MTTSTLSHSGIKRAFNFNAGPAAIPLPVLERVREELLDYRGTGMSVMEISHRSAEYEAINHETEQRFAKPSGDSGRLCGDFRAGRRQHAIHQGAHEPGVPGKPIDVLHTGAWTAKAIGELKKGLLHHIAAMHGSGEIHARAAGGRD